MPVFPGFLEIIRVVISIYEGGLDLFPDVGQAHRQKWSPAPENVALVRVYRIAGAAVYTDSRIVEKYRDQLAQIFTQIGLSFLHSQCQLALEIEMLRKYTILAMLYKLDQKSVCLLTIKDIPELKCAAESKPYEDENEIR